MSMKEKILKMLSERERSSEELRKEIKDEKLNSVIEEMKNSGLIFFNKAQKYSITLLGKILTLGLTDAYKKIIEKKEFFDFFKTRIPSKIPDELLFKFDLANDFQIIGKPDFIPKQKEITNKIFDIHPYAEKEIYVSAPIIYRPPIMHTMTLLKKRSKTHLILPKQEYEKSDTFIKVAQKLTNLKIRVIKPEDQYMGLLIIDNKFCFFGFRDLENKPGWDAVIYTETRECIEWVKENFDYMWKNLAFSEE